MVKRTTPPPQKRRPSGRKTKSLPTKKQKKMRTRKFAATIVKGKKGKSNGQSLSSSRSKKLSAVRRSCNFRYKHSTRNTDFPGDLIKSSDKNILAEWQKLFRKNPKKSNDSGYKKDKRTVKVLRSAKGGDRSLKKKNCIFQDHGN